MASIPKPLDYAAYLRSPEIKRRYDIVDGEWRFMSPAPNLLHQEILLEISAVLRGHVKRHALGKVYVAPADVIISKSPMRTRQPDVMYISKSRLHLARESVHGGPDLVVEILSPGNAVKYVQQKLRDYASVGVLEAWLVNPKEKTIAVWLPEEGEFRQTALFGAKKRLRSKVLPRLVFPVGKAFPR